MVAIKVLDMPGSSGFMEEMRVLSKFRHPNLVILMGFGRHGSNGLTNKRAPLREIRARVLGKIVGAGRLGVGIRNVCL